MTPTPDLYFEDWDVSLHLGDAAGILGALDDGVCDAVVTSPPYLDARPEYPSPTGDEFSQIFRELRRVCTGPLLLNVGRLWRERVELLWWVELLERAMAEGWPHRDTLIWVKENANPFQGEVLTNAHEYVFLLGDGFDPDAVRTPYDEVSLARMKRRFLSHEGVKGDVKTDRSDMEYREPNEKGARGKSIFICSTGKEKGNEHPAPMPLDLAEHLVKLSGPGVVEYCPVCQVRAATNIRVPALPGGLGPEAREPTCSSCGSRLSRRPQVVLDPFAGSGTTLLAARKLGRRALGIELSPEYAQMCAERMSQQTLSL